MDAFVGNENEASRMQDGQAGEQQATSRRPTGTHGFGGEPWRTTGCHAQIEDGDWVQAR